MKNIKIVSVKRFPTERKTRGEYSETTTSVRWTFSNGVIINVLRMVIDYSASSQSKIISITPIGGFNESYLEVSRALRATRKVALQTFGYSWDINIEL